MRFSQIIKLQQAHQEQSTGSPISSPTNRPLVEALVNAIDQMFDGKMPPSLRAIFVSGLARTKDDDELRKLLTDVIAKLTEALNSVPSDSAIDAESASGRDGSRQIDASDAPVEAMDSQAEQAFDHNRLEA